MGHLQHPFLPFKPSASCSISFSLSFLIGHLQCQFTPFKPRCLLQHPYITSSITGDTNSVHSLILNDSASRFFLMTTFCIAFYESYLSTGIRNTFQQYFAPSFSSTPSLKWIFNITFNRAKKVCSLMHALLTGEQ